MNLKVILASTRQNRQGEKIASWVLQELKDCKNFDVELLDLRDYQLPYYDDPIPAGMLKPPYSPEVRQKWAEKISSADAFLIITPEYNHSYPAVLKSALDSIYHEWSNKPVAFLSYGGSANGSRAVEHLRLVAIELQMAPIREGVHIGLFSGEQVFDESGNMLVEANVRKLQKLNDQLYWWADALKKARDADKSAK